MVFWSSSYLILLLPPSAHQHPLDHEQLMLSGCGGLDHDPTISRPWIMTSHVHRPVDVVSHYYPLLTHCITHALPQRTSSEPRPRITSTVQALRPRSSEHSIDCGYSHPKALSRASLRVSSTRDPRCSAESEVLPAVARGLSARPLPRPSR